jgi:hypothetical protein
VHSRQGLKRRAASAPRSVASGACTMRMRRA